MNPLPSIHKRTKGDNLRGRTLYKFLQVKNLKVKKIVLDGCKGRDFP